MLGTFQYMAPEQLEGQEADARTDLFAFGVVLYEMLAGRRAFEGKTHASLIGAILKDEPPPVSSLRPLAPASLDHVVVKCLEKDPDARWQSAHDLHDELAWIAARRVPSVRCGRRRRGTAGARAGGMGRGRPLSSLSSALWILGSGWRSTPVASDAQEMRLQIVTPPERQPRRVLRSRRTAVRSSTRRPPTAARRLWIRSLDSDTARPLEGTDGASRRRRSGRPTAGRSASSRPIS